MKLIKSLHKWLSILVALQCFIWLSSALFFNLMDSSKASGNQYRIASVPSKNTHPLNMQSLNSQALNTQALNDEQDKFIEPRQVLSKLEKGEKVYSIKLITLLNKPYYLINHKKALYKHLYNQHSLVDAVTAEQVSIDQGFANRIALSSYKGSGDIVSSAKKSPPFDDFGKEENTLWVINLNDEVNTSIYVDASSGRLVGHSNDDKRFADFFFMLHFMDYGLWETSKTGGFNNGVIILLGMLMLIFCLTGFIWGIELARKGGYSI